MADNVWKTFSSGGENSGPYYLDELSKVYKILKNKNIDRVYWIYNPLDEQNCFLKDRNGNFFWGIEAVEKAVKLAHKEGLQFFAVYKPFENGHTSRLPEYLSSLYENQRLKYLAGVSRASDFVLKHPEMRIQRKPQKTSQNSISKIILNSSRNPKAGFSNDNLTIFVAKENGKFQKYSGSYTVKESTAQVNGKDVSRVSLTDLDIKPEWGFILIKYTPSQKDKNAGVFLNNAKNMIKCFSANGDKIKITHDTGPIPHSALSRNYLIRWLNRHPEQTQLPKKHLPPSNYGNKIENTAYKFGIESSNPLRKLDHVDIKQRKHGYVAFVRGADTYLPALHPAYPEVRKYWLSVVQKLIDINCDGIDIRISSHSTWTQEGEMYGFNPPVVKKYLEVYGKNILSEEYDTARLKAIQGHFFTEFLRDSKNITKKHCKKLFVHINYQMLDNKRWELNDVPANFKWEWLKWIQEGIIDGVTLKYLPWCFGGNDEEGKKYAATVGTIAKSHNLPVFINTRLCWWMVLTPSQLNKKVFTPQEYDFYLKRIKWALEQPWSDGIILYELSDFVMVDQFDPAIRFSPYLNKMLKEIKYLK
jgi:hypothetical protein